MGPIGDFVVAGAIAGGGMQAMNEGHNAYKRRGVDSLPNEQRPPDQQPQPTPPRRGNHVSS